MKKVLGKNPGYTVYKKIKETDVELSVEECIQKARWKTLEKKIENPKESPSKTNDMHQKEINFKNMKATELKSNKRVNMVGNGDIHFETKSENLKVELMKTTRKYMNENKDKNLQFYNLALDEKEGLKECKSNVDEGKAVIFETDKSKKFSINTPENYKKDMEIHIEKDKVVDKKFVNKITRMFNETTKSLVTILGIGEKAGHFSRIIKNVVVAEDSELPIKSGMFKDHKLGRKYRPLVNGNIGPIANISKIVSIS